jgi:MoaD family protein
LTDRTALSAARSRQWFVWHYELLVRKRLMSVEVRIPSSLRTSTSGERVVYAEGGTVGTVLNAVSDRYPGFASGLFAENGDLRRFVNIYLNDEDIRYTGKLETPVSDGDVVSILPAVAGGC